MEEFGMFAGDVRRPELIDGTVMVPPPMNPPHASTIAAIDRLLFARLGSVAAVRCQLPVSLPPHSEPLPDFTIAGLGAYREAHPGAADVFWLVEVAHASRSFDRERKVPMYARRGIREVWLIDLVDSRVTVYRKPSEIGYASIETFAPGECIAAEAFPAIAFTVDELLG